jgi:hypothetical protein
MMIRTSGAGQICRLIPSAHDGVNDMECWHLYCRHFPRDHKRCTTVRTFGSQPGGGKRQLQGAGESTTFACCDFDRLFPLECGPFSWYNVDFCTNWNISGSQTARDCDSREQCAQTNRLYYAMQCRYFLDLHFYTPLLLAAYILLLFRTWPWWQTSLGLHNSAKHYKCEIWPHHWHLIRTLGTLHPPIYLVVLLVRCVLV